MLAAGQRTADAQVTSFNVRALPSPCTSAAGTGSIDDTAAFTCAIGLVPASGGEIYMPAGTYLLTGTLRVENKNITFRGEGQRITNLVFEGNGKEFKNGGIEFYSNEPGTTLPPYVNHTLNVRSLSILRKLGTGGAGIFARWKQPVDASSYGGTSATIFDVHISTDPFPSDTTSHWWHGISLAGAVGARIHTFNIFGYEAGNDNASILIKAKSIGVTINDGDMGRADYGVRVEGGSESVRVENVETSQNTVGFFFQEGKHHIVSNCHAGVTGRGIQFNDVTDGIISGNFMILVQEGILVWNPALPGARFQVRDNLVVTTDDDPNDPNPPRHMIRIVAQVSDVVVMGNTVRAGRELGHPLVRPKDILLDTGVTNALVTNNYLRGYGVTNNAGASNITTGNH
jgi:hypothetical protein